MGNGLGVRQIQDELNQDEINYQKWQEELAIHLSKFQDLDKLFLDTENIIKEYFESQSIYKTIDEFKVYLKGEIQLYVESFSMERKYKKPIRQRLIFIETNYDKILCFGEENPVEARRKEEMKNIPSISETLHPKTKGLVGGITGAVRILLANK